MTKRILLITALAMSLVKITQAQDFWETLYFPDSTNIRCIAVNNQGNIFVGAGKNGATGGVYRSVDSAQSWELVLDIGDFGVLSIAINETGYIYIGRTGFDNFMVSYDNGETWEAIELPSYKNLVKILCVGQNTVFVSIWEDGGALLLRSVDGGVTWDNVFKTINHTSEYISDIAISSTGDIYICMMCYFPNMGGVYKSEDGGDTWEYVGLENKQVWSLEFNSNDDLFIGVWGDMIYGGGGLYAIYNSSIEIDELLFGTSTADMVINSLDHIYFTDVPGNIIRSLDNGRTFETVNEGLNGTSGIMSIDKQGFIYLASIYGSNRLARSINSTITSIEMEQFEDNSNYLRISPNPVSDFLDIRIPGYGNPDQITVKLYDNSGKLMKGRQEMNIENPLKIDVHYLKPGIYFIEVLNGKNKLTSKFIKT